MKKPVNKTATVYRVIAGLLGWFALILQLYIVIVRGNINGDVLFAIANYFSFFTILTNILVALALTLPVMSRASRWGRFFAKAKIQSAIAVYIVIVGIIYSLVLRSLWKPEGLQLVADRLLHDAMPVLYIIYWLFFVPKGTQQWKNVSGWLLYPFLYLVYSLVRGTITGWYPYPFIDASQISTQQLIINSLVVMAGFIAISLIVIGLDRLMDKSLRRA